jgi:hypothetical protein
VPIPGEKYHVHASHHRDRSRRHLPLDGCSDSPLPRPIGLGYVPLTNRSPSKLLTVAGRAVRSLAYRKMAASLDWPSVMKYELEPADRVRAGVNARFRHGLVRDSDPRTPVLGK